MILPTTEVHITSLAACSKLFEIIVKNVLFESCKNYISTAQHGFFPKRSVATNLVEFTSLCIRSMDAGKQVDAIYTDFKSAFDRVNHSMLLNKLGKLGMSDGFVRWFDSYLSGRSMKVRIGLTHLDSISIPSGVPQGSNLGPILFSLFINDVAFVLPRGERIFYADDVKIFIVITCIEDCVTLQEALSSFECWSRRNGLELCVAKCFAITFCRKRNPIHFDYSLSGETLERKKEIKDLGVILDTEMTFRPHYDDVLSRANKQLGFIFKIADGFRDPLCLKSLYCALVRSILESAVVVWCPYSQNWIDRFEAVQRKFLRLALRSLPWRDAVHLPHRCMLLGLDTLVKRRSSMQSSFIGKLLNGEIDAPSLLSELPIYVPERPLRRRNFLHLDPRNSRYGQHDPIRFMIVNFNNVFEQFDFI